MTDNITAVEKLRKILKRAVENDYDIPPMLWNWLSELTRVDYTIAETWSLWNGPGHTDEIHLNQVIFSHSFLKAFFGEKWEDFERICRQGGETKVIPFAMKAWEFRAYELAVSENRIDYLYQFVK